MLKIVRGRIRDHAWTDEEVIFQASPEFYSPAGIHFGSRMVFDSGYLYFIIGERGGMMEAQDITRPNGKIYRVYPDGRIPTDNPFAAQKTPFPASGAMDTATLKAWPSIYGITDSTPPSTALEG